MATWLRPQLSQDSRTVGEPINPEAWVWYYEHVGGLRCPIMDTWWQTETGCFMISPLPVSALKPGSATKPLPGIEADVVDLNGKPVPLGRGGLLVITTPWPSMLRTLYNNPERYKKTYWEQIPGGSTFLATSHAKTKMATFGYRGGPTTF